VHEVRPTDLDIFDIFERGDTADLDMTIKSETRSALDQTTNLGTGKVLGERSELGQVDVIRHDTVVPHLGGVNVKDLESSGLVRQGDLHVYFETTRSQ
jgi:hypothetical protein